MENFWRAGGRARLDDLSVDRIHSRSRDGRPFPVPCLNVSFYTANLQMAHSHSHYIVDVHSYMDSSPGPITWQDAVRGARGRLQYDLDLLRDVWAFEPTSQLHVMRETSKNYSD